MADFGLDHFGREHLASGDYDRVVLPLIQAIFGATTSNENPIIGTSGAPEPYVLKTHTVLLNSLDVRGDIEVRLADGFDPDTPVLIYVLSDLVIAGNATITTSLDLTLRASRVFGNLVLKGGRGKDGCHGTSYKGTPAQPGTPGSSGGRGNPGRDAKDPLPGFETGHRSTAGDIGANGEDGTCGACGLDAGDGTDGTDGNGFTLWVERFEDGDLTVVSDGGAAGRGGWGQDGGAGGDGGQGGTGGQGGNASITHGAARGGPGGPGGTGGTGGDGGKAGLSGKPGQNGKIVAWGPLHENAKPPSRIYIPLNPGRPADETPRHGKAGQGGGPGPRGMGGQGGLSSLTHSSGGRGPSGEPGKPGRSGREYTIPVPDVGAEPQIIPSDVDFGKHPSMEVNVLLPFLPEKHVIAAVAKGTVIDDWGTQAYFEGMNIGSLGPDYSFNGGRSTVRWDDGSDLQIAGWGQQARGLMIQAAPEGPKVVLELYCPTLLVNITLTSGAHITIEKGRFDEATQITTWDPTPLLDQDRLSRLRPILYTFEGRLGQANRLRFSGAEVLIHSLIVTDCFQCRSLPDC